MWQWHLLGHMQVCTSLQTTMPTPHHSALTDNSPNLKYVTTIPCNITYFLINVSQGSVATSARSGGIFNNHLTANVLDNQTVKEF